MDPKPGNDIFQKLKEEADLKGVTVAELIKQKADAKRAAAASVPAATPDPTPSPVASSPSPDPISAPSPVSTPSPTIAPIATPEPTPEPLKYPVAKVVNFTNRELLEFLKSRAGMVFTAADLSQHFGITPELAFDIIETDLKFTGNEIIGGDNTVSGVDVLDKIENSLVTDGELDSKYIHHHKPIVGAAPVSTPSPSTVAPAAAMTSVDIDLTDLNVGIPAPSAAPAAPSTTLEDLLKADPDFLTSTLPLLTYLFRLNVQPQPIDLIEDIAYSSILEFCSNRQRALGSAQLDVKYGKKLLADILAYKAVLSNPDFDTNGITTDINKEDVQLFLDNYNDIESRKNEELEASERVLRKIEAMTDDEFLREKEARFPASTATPVATPVSFGGGASPAPTPAVVYAPTTVMAPSTPPIPPTPAASPAAAPAATRAVDAYLNMVNRFGKRNIIIGILSAGAIGLGGAFLAGNTLNKKPEVTAPAPTKKDDQPKAEPKPGAPKAETTNNTPPVAQAPAPGSVEVPKNYQDTNWWREQNPEVQESIEKILGAKDAQAYFASYLMEDTKDAKRNPVEITEAAAKEIFNKVNVNGKLLNDIYFGLDEKGLPTRPAWTIDTVTVEGGPSGPKTFIDLVEPISHAVKNFYTVNVRAGGWAPDRKLDEGQTITATFDIAKAQIIKLMQEKAR